MTEKRRCAYFGCMHPLFEPTRSTQKYCCRDCCIKANARSEVKRKLAAKYRAKVAADPALRKARSEVATKWSYKHGKLPDWMYS